MASERFSPATGDAFDAGAGPAYCSAALVATGVGGLPGSTTATTLRLRSRPSFVALVAIGFVCPLVFTIASQEYATEVDPPQVELTWPTWN